MVKLAGQEEQEQLSSRVDDKSKLEEHLKSRQAEKKRALNSSNSWRNTIGIARKLKFKRSEGTEELSAGILNSARTLQLLRALNTSTQVSKLVQSKDLKEKRSAPPILLQTEAQRYSTTDLIRSEYSLSFDSKSDSTHYTRSDFHQTTSRRSPAPNQQITLSVLKLCSALPEILAESQIDICNQDVLNISNSLLFIDNDLCFSAACPTCSIRVPRVMLSIQTGYTPTASKVDNGKQIPQLLLILWLYSRSNNQP
ncbi:hypothetical protein F511_35125 [Dorcoceras hygrometricum]|uniref:Uncharacterized protein n=1 Tax=Dorcoceras hygrometricum TaxID=472368 RepID=A0A2Z7AM58_9LAMI|nr:hypothetical protein F511_35125 [Dorcoceras hygrometricum]